MSVTIYTSETCVPCKNIKKWLDMKGVSYELVDREAQPELFKVAVAQTGVVLVPQVRVENRFMVCPSISTLATALSI